MQTNKYQQSFLALAQTKKLKCERFSQEMNAVIPWNQFLSTILTKYQYKSTGRTKTDALLLLKIYFLQQWYALSDPGVEEAIYDRNSFQKFLRIDLLAQTVPDETTILNFRHFLEKYSLTEKFFLTVNQLMEKKGLILKKGTVVDATIISSPSSTKNKSKSRDKEMSSTKKGSKWYFGMKAHIGVDANTGIIHSLSTTTAKTSDKTMFKSYLHGEEKAKFGDKGYYDETLKKEARLSGIYWGILDKNKRNHPLSNKQHKQNHIKASIRAKVEFPFRVLKCQWHYTKTRYKGSMKNTVQLFAVFGLINLYSQRRALLYRKIT